MIWRILKWTGITLGVLLLMVVALAAYQVRFLWATPVFDTDIPADPGPVAAPAALIFSKTNGFRHASIEPGRAALTAALQARGWTVVHTEKGSFFNEAFLSRFQVVVFLCTTGDILTQQQEAAFRAYILGGGGYAGIHSAADTEHAWGWYDTLVGTHFRDHTLFPQLPEAVVVTEDTAHPATSHLPPRWSRVDEWYNYKSNPRQRPGIRVLSTLDESTYDPGTFGNMGGDHPITWVQELGAGRMFYTGMGHTPETFQDSLAMEMLLGGIRWAGRVE
ncbi:MAG: ThuA domain-containing protein [Bacteroidia bacterium]|nr:ThuA domain-containing protein [Bacteroidia bacterium]